MTDVVVFTGGRGTKFVQQAFARTSVKVTYLINGYDSGMSTGRVRWAYEGMLGPSDFRKCVSTALEFNDAEGEYASFLEDRSILQGLYGDLKYDSDTILSRLSAAYPNFNAFVLAPVVQWLKAFLGSEPVQSKSLAIADMPIGNALITGAFIEFGNFNLAIDRFQAVFLASVPNVKILNVTQGDDLWLSAISEGKVSVDEGFIVGRTPPGPIEKLVLVDRPTAAKFWGEYGDWKVAPKAVSGEILANSSDPTISVEALAAIENADLLIFGSGTQHSSLFPTYMTRGLVRAVAANQRAPKILFLNGARDFDFHPSESIKDALVKTSNLITSHSKVAFDEVVTEIFAATSTWGKGEEELPNSFCGVSISTVSESVHTASKAYNHFSAILTQELGAKIGEPDNVVSVIVPTLNESGVIAEFLDKFENLSSLSGCQVEKIIVDGGSNDGTWELIEDSEWASVFRIDSHRGGRAAAISYGMSKARGSTIAVFHSDLEYEIEDLERLIQLARVDDRQLVVGSRSFGASAETSLRKVYGERRALYWLSRLGGTLVASVLSMRVGRAISDPFCGIYCGDSKSMRLVSPGRGNVDALVQMFLNAHKLSIPLIQTGIRYSPRSRTAGKKTSIGHGFVALIRAFGPSRIDRT